MAIFYKHIKGCGPNIQYNSYIEWSDQTEAPTSNSYNYLPVIKIDDRDFGKILTSDADNQKITKAIEVEHITTPSINIGNHKFTKKTNNNLYYDKSDGSIKFAAHDGTYNKKLAFKATEINIHHTEEKEDIATWTSLTPVILSIKKDQITVSNKMTHKDSVHIQKALYAGSENSENTILSKLADGTIKAADKCEAKYFNATSDARAKSNITPAQFSALDVIKQLPIYTFNYLNDPKLSVGLIAQEAAEYDLDGFNMVDNLDAEGAFGDFMQIKESKLVYVLWKAIQELTDEINSLKAQIQQLENK